MQEQAQLSKQHRRSVQHEYTVELPAPKDVRWLDDEVELTLANIDEALASD